MRRQANSLATELATRPAALPVPQALRVETVPAELLERRPDLRAALPVAGYGLTPRRPD